MGIFSVIQKALFICISISVQFSCAISEESVPTKPAPFHNLIPRFKIPPGNLLRYKIPQWEVLYFLKYGIVPFIFYDPYFNRTNFITQVHKFKMYFDDGRPNSTSQVVLKDDESFREFLRTHGYPNFNQLPENALSRNNKIVEEINGLLQATRNAQEILNEKGGKSESDPTLPPSLEAIIQGLDRERPHAVHDEILIRKRSNNNEQNHRKARQNFWNSFITRYPLTWKYSGSVVGTRNLLLNQASNWMPERFPYSSFGRNTKSYRIGTRNVNMDTGGGDAEGRDSGASDSRKSGKTFQTQGW